MNYWRRPRQLAHPQAHPGYAHSRPRRQISSESADLADRPMTFLQIGGKASDSTPALSTDRPGAVLLSGSFVDLGYLIGFVTFYIKAQSRSYLSFPIVACFLKPLHNICVYLQLECDLWLGLPDSGPFKKRRRQRRNFGIINFFIRHCRQGFPIGPRSIVHIFSVHFDSLYVLKLAAGNLSRVL